MRPDTISLFVTFLLFAASPALGQVAPFTGATGDGITDDQPVLQAEIDRLCKLDEKDRILKLPAGDFRLGDDDGDLTEFYKSGLYIGECDGFKIIGSGRTVTRLLAGNDQGQSMIVVCDLEQGAGHEVPGNSSCSGGGSGENITYRSYVSDLTFYDPDPIASGGQNLNVIFAPVATGGTPAFDDAVTWTGGTGDIIEMGAELTGGAGVRYGITNLTGVLPAVGVTITNGVWTSGATISTRGIAVEGSHGFSSFYSDGLRMERIGCLDISDECVDLHKATTNATIRDVYSVGVGRVAEGGSTIAIDGSNNILINGFFIELGKRSNVATANGSGIDIATNTTTFPNENIWVKNGIIQETSVALEDRVTTGMRLAIGDVSSIIRNVNISNIMIDVDGANEVAFKLSAINGEGQVSISQARLVGLVETQASGGWQDTNATGVAFTATHTPTTAGDPGMTTAFKRMRGNSLLFPNHGSSIGNVLAYSTMVGNHFGPTALNDCVVLNTEGVAIVGNTFDDCGGASGGLDVAIQSNAGADFLTVTGNAYSNNGHSCCRYYVGWTGGGGAAAGNDANCGGSSARGADTVCGFNSSETN